MSRLQKNTLFPNNKFVNKSTNLLTNYNFFKKSTNFQQILSLSFTIGKKKKKNY